MTERYLRRSRTITILDAIADPAAAAATATGLPSIS